MHACCQMQEDVVDAVRFYPELPFPTRNLESSNNSSYLIHLSVLAGCV